MAAPNWRPGADDRTQREVDMANWLQRERFVFALIFLIGVFSLVVVFLLKYPYGVGSVDCSTIFILVSPIFFISFMPIGFYWEHFLRHGTLRGARPRDEVPEAHHWILAFLALAGGMAVAVVALVRFSPDCRFSIWASLLLALFGTLVGGYVKILYPKS